MAEQLPPRHWGVRPLNVVAITSIAFAIGILIGYLVAAQLVRPAPPPLY